MTQNSLETATFAAGCFWGIEDAFMKTPGVKETIVGYMGGSTDNPSYKMVCTGKTGHAETTQIQFNPREISYENLARKFFEIHDPTTLNRQGPDIGTQYRSVIFYHNPEQKEIAQKLKAEYDKSAKYKNQIVTEITPAKTFWRAEGYHQKYYQKKGKGFLRKIFSI